MLLFPAIAFAFSFENAVLPIHSVSRGRDTTGGNSFKACLMCLIICLLSYTTLMTMSFIFGEFFLNKNDCEILYGIPLLQLILLSDARDPVVNFFSILLLMLILIQCVLQLLYTFYESRTHLNILCEEIMHRSTSRYVDIINIKHY